MLYITDEGVLSIRDYKSIHRAILEVLNSGPKKMRDLMIEVQYGYEEFKYIKLTIVTNTIGELMKRRLVVSTYE